MAWGDGWGTGGGWHASGGSGSDAIHPTVTNFSPVDGTTIERFDPISFRASDETAMRRVVVWVEYAALGTSEMVHDGDTFKPEFIALSTRTPISAASWDYVLRPHHGWKSTPTIKVLPFDRGGNEPA